MCSTVSPARFARRMAGSAVIAEDIVQESFLTGCEQMNADCYR
jgi:DNA-directed RNA polymerase specialized sigma24 family protein